MNIVKPLIFSITLPLCLNGCIGTALLRDSDTSKPYPDLHTVPDAHPKEDKEEIQITIQSIEQQSNNQVNENKELRLKHGLLIKEKETMHLFPKRKQ
jgi:hypothetical protein